MAEVITSPTAEILGADAENLLSHVCQTIPKENLHLPGPNFVDEVWGGSDRNPRVVQALRTLFGHGRLGGSGYLSILPIDHGIAHTAGMVFAKNPAYFDPAAIVELAREGQNGDVADRCPLDLHVPSL